LKQWVYHFSEGNAEMKQLLGGKGANLAEMTRTGLPVPPGFTITTEACMHYLENDQILDEGLLSQVWQALQKLEEQIGKRFADSSNPLLVSVRSGSVFSMPGMMDTILNLGLNDQTVQGLAALTDERFAFDSYRRFIQMFSDVVLKIDHFYFENLIQRHKESRGLKEDTDLSAQDWQTLCQQFLQLVEEKQGKPFPQDPKEQLQLAIQAVFRSWNNERAKIYRQIHDIDASLGTAVNVQSMVFGNRGNRSGTGVAFTRNPSTGEKELYGEFLLNAQGEDVVAGIRTPQPIAQLQKEMPAVYEQFLALTQQLELHYRDMQDIEFTIEEDKLYLLQTRVGKRTAQAAVRIAVEMEQEGLISREEALLRIDSNQLDQLLHRRLDPQAELEVLAKGLPASPGAASGEIVFSADEAERLANQGRKVILVRPETTPEDIHGILAAEGVLTSRGGMTSHAAVVARGMGKACICGCEQLKIDLQQGEVRVGSLLLRAGDLISIDGSTGQVILGQVPLIDPELTPEFQQLLQWADSVRKLKVHANADNPKDARKARELGAEGIGLCRTEHMFMSAERVPIVQQMILATSSEERQEALDRLLPLQKADFKGIFMEMSGLPVTIRLLDPPLHEFLPSLEDLLVEVTRLRCQADSDQCERVQKENLLRKVRALSETNPMLGHRGCRLGMVFPEIYTMQIEAIALAAAEAMQEGAEVNPEIMIPLVGHVNELKSMRHLVEKVAGETMERTGQRFPLRIGTMIEVPRAALTAHEIAQEADFFSFGTNDLTQTTFGYSRDDAEGKFLHFYVENQILPQNPFIQLDTAGVGRLIEISVNEGRRANLELKTGICGEHGGEKNSIQFCHQMGLNYVSCSPFRVPLARLSAAQAALLDE
jgi:pyruvate,orthophosphate dikinase